MTWHTVSSGLADAIVGVLREQALDRRNEAAPSAEVPFSNMVAEDWLESVRLWLRHGAPLITDAPSRACPACAGGGPDIFVSHDGYPFRECSDCGCWYVPFEIDNRLFDRFFRDCPEAKALADRMIARRQETAMAKTDYARIEAYLQELAEGYGRRYGEVHYLDVGCGVGNAVKVAERMGVRAAGVDVNVTAVALGRERGLNLYSSLEDLPAGSRFDWISLWETLEHMVNPAGELERCRGLLAEGGIVVLTVPNLNGIGVRMQRGDCPYVHGGRAWAGHVNWFNSENIRRLLHRAGLRAMFVDGQFSHNPFELRAYLLGESRGARDWIAGRRSEAAIARSTVEAINTVGPALALFERVSLTTPILKIIACRQEDVAQMSQVATSLETRRRREMTDYASMLRDSR